MNFMDLAGLQPEKIHATLLRLYEGSCASVSRAQPTRQAVRLFSLDINLLAEGKNGIDVGQVVAGAGYHVYIIKDEATEEVAAVLSAARFYGEVVVPPGFALYRKLPFGFRYRPDWGGIPDFHLDYWPGRPLIRFTGAEETPLWSPLQAGRAADWTTVSVADFLPDNARMAYILCHVTPPLLGRGDARIRVIGSQTKGVGVGEAVANGASARMTLVQRVTSDHKLEYKTSNGAGLSLYVLGYSMTEPS